MPRLQRCGGHRDRDCLAMPRHAHRPPHEAPRRQRQHDPDQDAARRIQAVAAICQGDQDAISIIGQAGAGRGRKPHRPRRRGRHGESTAGSEGLEGTVMRRASPARSRAKRGAK